MRAMFPALSASMTSAVLVGVAVMRCGLGVAGDFVVADGGDQCVPACDSRVCGPDGCGGSCGTCATGTCNTAGQCTVASCVPQCTGKTCGPDGCGGTCGTCASGTCSASGQCQVACTPSCAGKTCGSNGCGGSCGTCLSGNVCSASNACVPLSSVALNLVFFGNSFSQCWGAPQGFGSGNYGVAGLVKDMATAKGFPTPRSLLVATGGFALSDHLSQLNSTVEHPSGYQWNVVVMQELSDRPTSAGDPAQFRADAATLLSRMRVTSPAAIGVLYETWAYGAANSWYTWSGVSTPAAMQSQLKTNYLAALNDLETAHPGTQKLSYSGELFRTQNWQDWLYSSDRSDFPSPPYTDYKHPSDESCYLVSLELFRTIYGASVDGLPPLLSTIGSARAAELQAMVSSLVP